ncbi:MULTISPECIES: hypothetical protein [Halocynthiibacter]|uniref:Uncharacterized protein n=1 Tax=Halocynthiibacter halioticoli TaxID=2986804 RepID=A0AAE3IW00_9RHOB|nr:MULTISPECIES: hypothetical protein [Halocynthiibacter]MCV6823083.1 hypothetical protein [Halocynthiibacter halioticoli]MCW4056084.1 hypothetical protein [Halocynthiibacter sp. SDUM655004]
MKRFGLILALLFLGVPLAAETIVVRSGEHKDFSRLVLDFSKEVDWSLHKVESGYALHFESKDLSILTNKVFDRIPRTRIADVSFDANKQALSLRLNCECKTEAFELEGDRLVLDVFSEEPTRSAHNNSEDNKEVASLVGGIKTALGYAITQMALLRPQAQILSGKLIVNSINPNKPDKIAKDRPSSLAAQSSNFERQLLTELGRVVNHGFVEIEPIPEMKPDAAVKLDTNAHPVRRNNSIQEEAPRSTTPTQLQSEIHDPLQHANASKFHKKPFCDFDFNLNNWATVEDPLENLRKANHAVQIESTESNKLKQIKAHIYAGLGSEALGLLEPKSQKFNSRVVLSLIAQRLTGKNPNDELTANLPANCGIRLLFWTSLGRNEPRIKTEEMKRQFALLPEHLQKKISALYNVELEGAVSYGDDNYFPLISEKVARELGELEASALKSIVSDFSKPQSVAASELVFLESIDLEFRETEIGRYTKEVLVEALINQNDFEFALETALKSNQFNLLSPYKPSLIERIFQANIDAETEEFLLFQLSESALEERSDLPPNLQKKISERLTALGFITHESQLRQTGTVKPTAERTRDWGNREMPSNGRRADSQIETHTVEVVNDTPQSQITPTFAAQLLQNSREDRERLSGMSNSITVK